MSAPVELSVVLPVHNQGDHIGSLVEQYTRALEQHFASFEIVLVTNGCTDDSVERCAVLEAELAPVRLIELDRRGWGHAVRMGIAAARGSVICYTNSARTSPDILILMLVYAKTYPSVVVKANRRIRESVKRRFGSLLYNLECRAVFDLSVWDINGTPKIFPRSFEKLLELRRDDDLIDLEFVLTCKEEDYPIIEVPILNTVRRGGRSTTNVRSALAMYVGALRMRHE